VTTIITRSALLAWGQQPPADLALLIREPTGHLSRVTWEDVLRARRQRQTAQVARKRAGRTLRAYRLAVAWYGTGVFGGWQALLTTYRGPAVWIDRDRRWLRAHLLAAYPLVLPMGDDAQAHWPAWEQWKVAFATQYTRRRQARKPLGMTYVWWDGGHTLRHAATPGTLPHTDEEDL
jgi:hypothetical protein